MRVCVSQGACGTAHVHVPCVRQACAYSQVGMDAAVCIESVRAAHFESPTPATTSLSPRTNATVPVVPQQHGAAESSRTSWWSRAKKASSSALCRSPFCQLSVARTVETCVRTQVPTPVCVAPKPAFYDRD